MSEITQEKMDQIAQMWNARGKGLITHMALKIEEVSTEAVQVRMPFNPDFCVDSDQTLLHGGILTALLDSVFGLANFVAIEGVSTMATLDLRVDYLRPARSRASRSTAPSAAISCTRIAPARRSGPVPGPRRESPGPAPGPTPARGRARSGGRRAGDPWRRKWPPPPAG